MRVVTAVLVAAVLAGLLDQSLRVQTVAAAGLLLAAAWAVGWHGRWAAVVLLLVLLLLVVQTTWPLSVSVVLLLVMAVHVVLTWETPPYGSLDATGRADPAGGWRFPPRLQQTAWLGLGAFYLLAGVVLLQDESWRLAEALFYDDGRWAVLPWVGAMPAWLGRALTWLLLCTWLAFGPLALSRRNRRLAWALALGVNLLVLPLAGQWALAAALLAMHLLAFDPAWLRPGAARSPETVFYDGDCGLCHRWVRFVLAEDRRDEPFVLSPLGSAYFRERVPAAQRDRLPDSIVVLRDDGELLTRSTAVLHILDRLGGLWRVAANVAGALPTGLRDWGYDRVAAVRKRWFASPQDACPVMPAGLRTRFRM